MENNLEPYEMALQNFHKNSIYFLQENKDKSTNIGNNDMRNQMFISILQLKILN